MLLAHIENYFEVELRPIYEKSEVKTLLGLALENVLRVSHKEIKRLVGTKVLEPTQVEQLLNILSDLKTGKPIQHILNEAHFYGLLFKVNKNVLIPRPETEELVHWIIGDLKNVNWAELRILDIGTGSGCIAVSLKKNLACADVYALDISKEAVETARGNARYNEVDINFVNADIRHYSSSQKFDMIVSNPPYVRQLEKVSMHNNVLNFEPHLALFVNDDDPLIYYKVIAHFAKSNLSANGALYFEINEHLGEETVKMLQNNGFKNVQLKKDMQGKDRMIYASL